jgi:broad specificity phosphatase PhoE
VGETTVFLIRHGVTDWHEDGKVLGRRDVALSGKGLEQARATADLLAAVDLGDLISSPLQRALQTAEIIAERFDIDVARDPRLTDFDVGQWAGMTYEEVAASPEYQRYLSDASTAGIPGGECLEDVRGRAVAALEQAISDSPTGEAIGLVTHAGVIRVVLAHYLGASPANYHRLRVSPGSVSVLSFSDDRDLPRVLGVNCAGSLARVLEGQ